MTGHVVCSRCGIIHAGVAVAPQPPGEPWRCCSFEACFERMVYRDVCELLRLPNYPQPTHTFPEAMALLPRHLAPT